MASGKVKWFNEQKGFGFIEMDEGGKDTFIHMSVLRAAGLDSLADGQAVEIEVEQGEKGPQAKSVALA